MTPGIGDLTRHAVSTRFEDLPTSAVAAAKTFLIDTIGVGVAGTSGLLSDRLPAIAASWGTGDEATCWVTGERLPAPSAALVNAYRIHCLEFDCVHEGAVLHPMATILSTLCAYAERRAKRGRPVSGRELIAALAVGVDVATLLGMAATGPIRFFRPATAGGFGALAALVNLEGCGEETAADAFGLQYGQCSGTLQPHLEGKPLLGLQIGVNARAALTSLDLALAGFSGPRDILTGKYGYLRLFEDEKFDVGVFDRLGTEWQIARLAHKPYPSGRLTHGVVHALRVLAERGVPFDQIERLTAQVPDLVARLVGRPDIPDPEPNYAKLCLPFVAGVWVAKGRCEVADFLGEELRHPGVHAFAGKVAVEFDGNPDPNAMAPQRFVARLTSGLEVAVDLPAVFGHPDAPLSAAENEAKFRRCWASTVPALPEVQADATLAFIEDLEGRPDVAALTPLLLSPAGARA